MVAQDSSQFPIDAGRLPSGTDAKLRSMRGTRGPISDLVHRLGVEIGVRLNGSFYYPSDDRSILECVIIPYFQLSAEHQRILFVGTDWYTQGYARMFTLKHLTTIDAKPASARYGAPHHIVDTMAAIDRHVRPGALDLVLCNGVVGWGLDTPADAEAAFGAACRALRPGGLLMVGWNDLEQHRPFRLADIASIAKLEPWVCPPLGVSQHLVDNAWRHVFSFYRKPEHAAA